jgi:hypothetical protein
MQRSAEHAGFSADEAARLAAHSYWGSGVAGSQAGLLRAGAGMYGQQGQAAGLFGPEYGMHWPYRGPLIGAEGGYSRQQHEMMMQGAEGAPQHKRGSSQGRQQGRLGRMASRIYSLRPRLRKGDSSERALASTSAGAGGSNGSSSGAAGLYSQLSASFKNGLSALTSADIAARADSAAPSTADMAAVAAGAADSGEAGATAASQGAAASTAASGSAQPLDLSDTPAVLSSLGLAPDTAVVGPQYYIGGPQGPAAKSNSLNHRCVLSTPCTPDLNQGLSAHEFG